MKNVLIVLSFLAFNYGFSQKIADKYESRQPQDLTVPAPPVIAFPSQHPRGNKYFVDEIKRNVNLDLFKSKQLKTKLILKISADGTVLNVSTFGNNETFNKEVKKVAKSLSENVKWKSGKNKMGENVIDIVSLPIEIKN